MHSSGRAPAKRRTRLYRSQVYPPPPPPPLSIRTTAAQQQHRFTTDDASYEKQLLLCKFEFCYSTAGDKITDTTPHPFYFIALSCRTVLCLPLGLMLHDGGRLCAFVRALHWVESSFHIRYTHRHIPRNSLKSQLYENNKKTEWNWMNEWTNEW